MTVKVPPAWYANLSETVLIGGKGSNGVSVAYDAGSNPGGVSRPLTADKGWKAASPSGKRSAGDNRDGDALLGATMTVSGARSRARTSSIARGRRLRGRAGDWNTPARRTLPSLRAPRPAACKHPCFFTLVSNNLSVPLTTGKTTLPYGNKVGIMEICVS